MQTLSTTWTAVLLLAVVMVTAGCGDRGTGSVESPTDTTSTTRAGTATSTTPTAVTDVATDAGQMEPTGLVETPQASPSTTTTSVAALPELPVDDIDSALDGFDEALAELDQLLNQAAAALAAEEGEIIP